MLKAPWKSITCDIACNLRLLGLPTEFLDTRVLNVAARLVTSTTATAQSIFGQIQESSDSLEAALNPRRAWHATPLIASFQRVHSGGGTACREIRSDRA